MLKKFSKKRIWILLALIVFTISAVIFYLNVNQTHSQASVIQPVKVGELSQETVAGANFLLTGTVKPNDKRSIALDPKAGKVLETLVQEGDQVTVGQELFRYVNPEHEFEIRQAQLAVENQEKLVNQKQEDANYKWGQYNEKNNELTKLQQKTNQASAEEKTIYQQEKSTQEEIVSQSLNEARMADAEVSNENLALEKARLDLEAANQLYGQNTVVSEINGTVLKIDVKQLNNGLATDNKNFMEIVDNSSMYVEGKIDEFRKDQLQLEQEVTAIDRSDDTQTWNGKITKIGALASAEDASQQDADDNPNLSKYPFRVLLDNQDAMPALDRNVFISVNPIVNEGDIFLPIDYVVKEKDAHFVWTLAKKKLKKVPVNVEENETFGNFKITEGLTIDEEIVYPNENFKEGAALDEYVEANEY